jgi:hypothetical protein
LAGKYKNNGERRSDKRELKTDIQRYVFKAIPQGFSSTNVAVAQPFQKIKKQKAVLETGSIGYYIGSGEFRICI